MPRRRRTALPAVLLAAAGCSASTTPAGPSTTSAPLRAEVTDAVGDTSSDPRVPIPPDLVRATVDVAAGNCTFVIQLAPGTFDRQTTRVSVLLDTDQDASTGIRQPDGIGADYAIDFASNAGQAAVTKADAVACAAHLTCFNPVSSVPITFVTNGMQVTMPLALVGSADGRLSFQVSSYVLVAPLSPVLFDFMPDSYQSPGRAR